jgi:hypothetical protein
MASCWPTVCCSIDKTTLCTHVFSLLKLKMRKTISKLKVGVESIYLHQFNRTIPHETQTQWKVSPRRNFPNTNCSARIKFQTFRGTFADACPSANPTFSRVYAIPVTPPVMTAYKLSGSKQYSGVMLTDNCGSCLQTLSKDTRFVSQTWKGVQGGLAKVSRLRE